jgi:hypothetical protein
VRMLKDMKRTRDIQLFMPFLINTSFEKILLVALIQSNRSHSFNIYTI